MTSVAILWLLGLACVIVALLGAAVKVGGIELPGAAARSARVGVLLVGLIALILGTVLFTQRNSPASPAAGHSPAGTAATPGATTPAAMTPQAPPAAASSPAAAPASVLWHGKVRLSDGEGVDVGELPIRVEGSNSSATSFWQYDGAAHSGQSGNNLLSEWTGPADPTAAQCDEQLRTQPVERINGYRTGLRLCTHGLFDERIGYAKVVSYDGSTSQVDLTVWSLQFDED
jgi:hypothetical protein